jgi:hypothetical protein
MSSTAIDFDAKATEMKPAYQLPLHLLKSDLPISETAQASGSPCFNVNIATGLNPSTEYLAKCWISVTSSTHPSLAPAAGVVGVGGK